MGCDGSGFKVEMLLWCDGGGGVDVGWVWWSHLVVAVGADMC